MRRVRALLCRVAATFDRQRRDRELADELEANLQLHTDDNIRAGMSAEEARRQAMIKFGGIEPAKEAYREQRGLPAFEHFAADLRYSLRVMRRNPGFTTVAVLTLALGIGSSTAVFTVANAVLLRPMPYPEADRIVLIWGSGDIKAADQRSQVSFTDIEDVRRRSRVFSAVANFADWTPTLAGEGEPARLAATQVGDDFFRVMGVKPVLGRAFTPEEQIDGRDRVVILSHELWKAKFNADPGILGRAIRLNSVPHVVVGVMPEAFEPLPSTLVQGGQLYRPVAEQYDDAQRNSQHLRAIARLKAEVTTEQAQQDVDRITRELQVEHPREDADLHYRIAKLQEDTARDLKPSLLVLFGAVMMLLAIACANVAGLLLARGSARQKEIAIRTALGASTSRLVQQALTESLALATIGGAVGLLIALWGTRLAALVAPKVGSPLAHAALDGRVLAFAAVAVLLTAVLFGAAPALQSAISNLAHSLKQGGQAAEVSRRGKRLHSGIIVAELAIALVLLTVAGLLVRSFQRLQQVELGFNPQDRVVMNVWLPFTKYSQPQQQIAFYSELLRRVAALPGVSEAAVVQNPPLGNFDGRGILPEGRANIPQNFLSPQGYFISPDYLRTLGIPLLRGRNFNEADDRDHQLIAMVSALLAKLMWPGEDPIGKRLQLYSDKKVNGQYPLRMVVGVVADVHHLGPEERVLPGLYVPFRQLPTTFMTLIVHASQPKALIPSIRGEVSALDKELAVFRVGTYEEFLAESILVRRLSMLLVVLFGAMALFLAAVGLYGLVAYVVSRRVREFGVRAALGAKPADLLRLVVGSGLRLMVVGIAAGVAASLVAARAISSVLFGVKPADALTILASVVILAAAGLVASVVPARNAARVDPVEALRGE